MRTPLVLRPTAGKTIITTLGSIALFLASILMLQEEFLPGIFGIIFFGAGIIIMPISYFSGKLILDDTGFIISMGFRRESLIRWNQVEEFHVVTIHGLKMVGIRYSKEYQQEQIVREFNRQLSGTEGTLPDTYGYTAENLVELLNNYRTHYTAQNSHLSTHH